MVEIPEGATHFLSKRSFINCFFGIKRISPVEYEQAECEGVVTISGRLPTGYLAKVKIAVNNDLMTEVDIVEAVAAIERVLPPRA